MKQTSWPHTRLGYWKEYLVNGKGAEPKVGVEVGGAVVVPPLTERVDATRNKADERRVMIQTKGCGCKDKPDNHEQGKLLVVLFAPYPRRLNQIRFNSMSSSISAKTHSTGLAFCSTIVNGSLCHCNTFLIECIFWNNHYTCLV